MVLKYQHNNKVVSKLHRAPLLLRTLKPRRLIIFYMLTAIAHNTNRLFYVISDSILRTTVTSIDCVRLHLLCSVLIRKATLFENFKFLMKIIL